MDQMLMMSPALTVRPGTKPIELPVDATDFVGYARRDATSRWIRTHTGDTMETIFRTRYVSIVAVIFGAIGAVLMFVIGAVTTVDAVLTYLGGHEQAAFSSDAALAATVEIVSSLDQFLLGLVLLVFAFGVYSLWIATDTAAESSRVHAPEWIKVTSITDLKVQLIEVVAVLLAVLFLKGVLSVPETVWSDLVVPIAVVLLAGSVWLIRKAGH
jgi:uncharacterized membrane protein YqhA